MKKAKKKRKASVPKLGIYLPDARAAEVEEYRDRMNFSALFWSAFDQEKYRLDCIPKGQTMNDTVERLRKSKLGADDNQRSEGRAMGAKWASEQAEYTDLLRLRNYSELCQMEHVIHVTAEAVASLFDEGFDFWEVVLGDDHEVATDAFAEGFVDSALDVLAEAERQGL